MAEIFTLWVADRYGRGCPDNASPRKAGHGSTRKGAINNCEPWNDQAPWFRRYARPVTLTDNHKPSMTSSIEIIAWDALGWIEVLPRAGGGHKAIVEALHAGNFATAARIATECGYLQ